MSHRPGESKRQPKRESKQGWKMRGATLLAVLLAAGQAQASDNLVLLPEPMLMLQLIVLFVVLIFPVNQLVFKPILRVLDERDERINGTRHRATQLEQETDAVLSRYESQVARVRDEAEQSRRALLEEARRDATGTTGGARAEAEGEIERARQEVAEALEAARATLRGQSQELARQAAARVLGRPL